MRMWISRSAKGSSVLNIKSERRHRALRFRVEVQFSGQGKVWSGLSQKNLVSTARSTEGRT